MTLYDKIQSLAKKEHVSLKTLALNLGFSENYFYIMKRQNSRPSQDKLEKIADYFHISVDYLLGRTDSSTSENVENDLEVMVNSAMSFGGKPLSDNDREFVKKMLRLHLESKENN
ncbi:helix-turn-helix domain-containing protein [Floricoccus penangensis]|uniref:HTH cro/C1-type domain-containing protein n=1 Tax=Floricoccus penangensis TaxID=1859475 RepID=A0A9Q5JFW9_9LACT|nr:helix-turn-helix transcriptional regulator [Floricoccus penangensis]OFI46334.1 hypothetical protein BG262_04785 [Floricoccus penangensis]URZ87063.1 helix-turn-helix domain-containing protein [Floricoccus penangensis]